MEVFHTSRLQTLNDGLRARHSAARLWPTIGNEHKDTPSTVVARTQQNRKVHETDAMLGVRVGYSN